MNLVVNLLFVTLLSTGLSEIPIGSDGLSLCPRVSFTNLALRPLKPPFHVLLRVTILGFVARYC